MIQLSLKTIVAIPGNYFKKRVFFRLFFPSQSSALVSRGPGSPVDTHRGSPCRQHRGIQHHHGSPSPEWEPPTPFSSISATFLPLHLCKAPHEHRSSPGSDRGAVTLMSWPQEPGWRPAHCQSHPLISSLHLLGPQLSPPVYLNMLPGRSELPVNHGGETAFGAMPVL